MPGLCWTEGARGGGGRRSAAPPAPGTRVPQRSRSPGGRPRRRPPARGQPEGAAWPPGASPGGGDSRRRVGSRSACSSCCSPAVRRSVRRSVRLPPLSAAEFSGLGLRTPPTLPGVRCCPPVQSPPGAGLALSFAARPRLSWLNCLCSAKRDKSGLTEGGGGIDIVSL